MKSIPKDHVYLPQYAITASLNKAFLAVEKKEFRNNEKISPVCNFLRMLYN